MKKIALVYWSGTGNTKIMAEAIGAGLTEAQVDVDIFEVSSTNAEEIKTYDAILFGCPSMGIEVLEEMEFEPFFTAVEDSLANKKVALFGSYDWGDGEWMRVWQERVIDKKADLFKGEGLIVHERPGDDEINLCKEFGKSFASFCE